MNLNEIKGYWLFLDDERQPVQAYYYTHNTAYALNVWVVVRNYDDFVKMIETRGLPSLVSFDHDLADVHYGYLHGEIPYDKFKEKTGWHCAKWLVDYCLDKNQPLPDFLVHSMNPTGGENIKGLLWNFKKFQDVQKESPSDQS